MYELTSLRHGVNKSKFTCLDLPRFQFQDRGLRMNLQRNGLWVGPSGMSFRDTAGEEGKNGTGGRGGRRRGGERTGVGTGNRNLKTPHRECIGI